MSNTRESQLGTLDTEHIRGHGKDTSQGRAVGYQGNYYSVCLTRKEQTLRTMRGGKHRQPQALPPLGTSPPDDNHVFLHEVQDPQIPATKRAPHSSPIPSPSFFPAQKHPRFQSRLAGWNRQVLLWAELSVARMSLWLAPHSKQNSWLHLVPVLFLSKLPRGM